MLVHDKTEQLFALVRQSESYVRMKNQESFLSLQPDPKSDFVLEAEDVANETVRLQARLAGIKTRYMDFSPGSMSDRERDELDTQISDTIKRISARINGLKEADHGSGLGAAHRLGIAVSLADKLQEADKVVRELRGERIKHAVDSKNAREAAIQEQRLEDLPPRDAPQRPPPPVIEDQVLLQSLEQENHQMESHLLNTLDQVQDAEKKMMEIAALNQVLASSVLEQSKDIQDLYTTAVGSIESIEAGNRQLEMLSRRRVGLQLKVALFLVLAALSLIIAEALI